MDGEVIGIAGDNDEDLSTGNLGRLIRCQSRDFPLRNSDVDLIFCDFDAHKTPRVMIPFLIPSSRTNLLILRRRNEDDLGRMHCRRKLLLCRWKLTGIAI
jgi:hypothetical protein